MRWMLLVLCTALCTSQLPAQYFGRNRVRYDDFAFRVMRTAHFDIYYYDEEARPVRQAAQMAERWYSRLRRILADSLHGRQPVVLYGSHPQFAETNIIQEDLGQGTGGVTEPVRRRIVLPFAGPLAETDHVIGHELVHAFQFDMTEGRTRGGSRGLPGAERLPLWFVEGMAEYLSLGPVDANTAMWIRDAAQQNKLPSISDLNSPEFFPYRYGQALLAYVGGRWGDRTIGTLLTAASALGSVDAAIDTVLGLSPDSLSRAWHLAVHTMYDSLLAHKPTPTTYGRVLIGDKGAGHLNVSPVLSPDGRELAFFSERDLFSINLFLADAVTGKVSRTILHTELDPHFQNLEFIASAGAWSPNGARFAFAGVDKGRPFLSLLDVRSGTIIREIPFPTLGEIYSPTWSPDGRRIAFSALASGITDLFLYDLQTDSLRRLTDDAYADLQPVWSPDGERIAFVTDRFTTHLGDLDFGSYELATVDLQTGGVRRLAGLRGSRNFNPQYAAGGRELYFLADPDGITNIYKLDVERGTILRVTDLGVGVSGITALSPALSLSADGRKAAYSVFHEGSYAICLIDSAGALAGSVLPPPPQHPVAAFLPPRERTGDLLTGLLHDPSTGLPKDTSFTVSDYRASLALEGVSQPTAAIGVDRFGTYGGGGVTLLWGDMLGDHFLATALQLQSGGGYTDISALVGYMNNTARLNWGVVVQQNPYNAGYLNAGYSTVNNTQAYVEQEIVYRQINRDAAFILSYPFSQVFRAELSAGYRNTIFRGVINTRAYDLATGQPLLDRSDEQPHAPALNLGIASGAFVFDNSVYGATSPLLGQRWRLEVSPTVGSLRWTDLILDYRRYIMPIRPFTLAGRILHYGRYGRDADSPRLSPVYLGYPGLVRGYDESDLNLATCGNDSSGGCPAYGRLVGSRMLIGNLELRFPLFGLLGLGRGYYGFLPLEVALFYDTGVAWDKHSKPSWFGGANRAVSSVGFAARLNFFGYAIGQVDFVRPLDHLENGWRWQFSLSEGF